MIFEERIARWAKLKQPDRAAIQKLETFLDTEFYEKSKLGGYTRAYTKNKQGRITGIAISAIEAESSITSFHHFEKNILRNTISILKEFNQLSALNFYDNQISDVYTF